MEIPAAAAATAIAILARVGQMMCSRHGACARCAAAAVATAAAGGGVGRGVVAA